MRWRKIPLIWAAQSLDLILGEHQGVWIGQAKLLVLTVLMVGPEPVKGEIIATMNTPPLTWDKVRILGMAWAGAPVLDRLTAAEAEVVAVMGVATVVGTKEITI